MNRISRVEFEKGQAIIAAIIAMLILLIAIFFLFDIHSIIRVKIKAQTAADSAALTAANWQKHTLNLIGELNLVKASTVLVETVFPGEPDPLKKTDIIKIEEAADVLTEMQSRIAFVGPMIGFGAAQQAAKNNGMNYVPHYNGIVARHIDLLSKDEFYGLAPAGIPQVIPPLDADGKGGGYHWRNMSASELGIIPYRDMIESVLYGQGGIAAAPNVDFAALPIVTPEWLMKLDLYSAIASEYWCYGDLRAFVKAPRTDFWRDIDISYNPSSFPEECEYSPIYIDYSEANVGESAQKFLDAGTAENGNLNKEVNDKLGQSVAVYDPNNFPEIRWCIYEDKWDTGRPTDNWTSLSPNRGNRYLRSPLKPEYNYGGAVSKMTCIAKPEVISARYVVDKKPNLKKESSWISRNPGVTDATPVTTLITCSALAKPLGSLSGNTPNSVRMVLPVFTQAVLIPVAMQDPTGLYDPFNEEQYNLFLFLKWLSENNIDIGQLGDPIPADCPSEFYMICLQKLNTESWRSKGFKQGFVFNGSNNSDAGWLQKVIDFQSDRDNEGKIVYTIIRTNEDTCDNHPGTGGSDPDAPRILH